MTDIGTEIEKMKNIVREMEKVEGEEVNCH